MGNYAYFQKKFMPLGEAKIGILTHAFHYGTACFEGIRGNWNSEQEQLYLFRLPEHFERLHGGAKLLKMKLAYTVDELCKLAVELAQRSDYHENVYLRPLAYKSSETIGVKLHDVQDDFLMIVVTLPPYIAVGPDGGIKVCTSPWRRVDDTMIPARGKITGIYVNSAFAKTEAHENGYPEAIMLTHDGHVSEGTGENVFIVHRGKLITPPSSDNILMGITRDSVMTLARNELGIETVERSIDRSELYFADECFLTGTAAHITPVLQVDHRDVGTGRLGPVTEALNKLYVGAILGDNPKYSSWCTPVYPATARVPQATQVKARIPRRISSELPTE